MRNPAFLYDEVTEGFMPQHSKSAIETADKAFQSWQFSTPATKAAIFRKAASIVVSEKWAAKITQSTVEETGAIASWAKFVNVNISQGALEEACDWPYTIKGEIPPSDSGAQSFIQKYPMGVMLVNNYPPSRFFS